MTANTDHRPSYVGFKALDMGFDAHLTVCYFGKDVAEETLLNIRQIVENPIWQGFLYVKREDIKLFGPDGEVPVVTVWVPIELKMLRKELEQFSISQFTEWNPHISLVLDGPETIQIPEWIKLVDLGVY